MIRSLFLLFAALLTLSSASDPFRKSGKYPGKWFDTLSTMYTGGVGAAGVNLNRYPLSRANVGPKFGRRALVPIAVHTSDVPTWKYRVLEIRSGKRRVFGHVVDECASGDCPANYSKAKRRGAMLLDLHKTAWNPLGLSKMDTYAMKARVVGYLPSRRGKGDMAEVLTDDGKKGYVPSKWKV